MKLTILTFSFLLLIISQSFSQSDKEAIKVLDAFSAKAANAPSVSMKFNLVTVNQAESTTDTLTGSVILSKDKYRLDLPDNIIFYNGETSWSFLPAEKEVTITKADKKDNSFQNKPSAIFSMYKSGYKSRLVEEKTTSYIIDLYPEDLKSDLLRIRLSINKPQLNLMTLEYKRKDGITNTLFVLDYDLKQKPLNEIFVFQTAKYKDVEVVDMR
jgi:outer membrane lipoprotein carrier protein